MTDYFNAIDYSVIALYVVGLVSIGFVLTKYASQSLEGYIVGGRQLPWWALGFSGVASFLDMAGTAIIVAFLFLLGPRGLFIEFRGGVCLILAFMMLWMGKWHRRSGCLTSAEWMVFRFGNGFGGQFARITALLAVVLSSIGMLAMLVFGAGQFLAVFLPLSPTTCSVVLLVIATTYAAFSGFYGVVFTDIFQGAFILGATAYIAITAFLVAPDASTLGEMAQRVTGNATWTSSSLPWLAPMPEEFDAYQYLMLFAGLYFFRQMVGGMAAGDDPKYFGARNDRECGTLTFFWTCLMSARWPLMMGIAILGLVLVDELLSESEARSQAVGEIRTAYPNVSTRDWDTLVSNIANQPANHPPDTISSLQELLGAEQFGEKVKMLSFTGAINAEKVLPAVLLMKVPPGIRGLLVVALIAAFMSTFDSHLNRATGMVVRDGYQAYFRPQAETRELIRVSWATAFGLVFLSVLFALTIESINDIWSWMIMGLTAGFLAPFVLRFYWWRFTGTGFAAGTLFGMLAAVVQRLYAPAMHEFLVFVIVMIAGTVGSILGSLLSKPVDDRVLWQFYNRTRPFGLWKPLRDRLSESEQRKVGWEHRCDLLALPFAILWQVSMFMVSMLVLVHNWSESAIWGGMFLIGLGGLYVFWYRNLPATNWYEAAHETLPQEVPPTIETSKSRVGDGRLLGGAS